MSKLAKTTIFLMLASLVSKILGFGREVALASAYGTSAYSDAYLIALNIPNVIFASIGAAIGTTFIPLYYDIETNRGNNEALLYTNNITNIISTISIIIALICLIFTEPIVKLFAVGFNGETLTLAVKLTRVLIIGILFIGLSNIMTAYLNIKGNFTVPGLIGVPYSFIIIISILISKKFGIMTLAYGTLLGMASQFLFQLPFAYKRNYSYKFKFNLKDEYLKKMIFLVGPIFIGVTVNQLNAMIDRTLASTLAEGSISALNYAYRLNGFVMGMFIASIASVIYPTLSKLSNEKNQGEFIKSITSSVNSVILLIIPISFGAIVLAKPIVSILFERGEFTSQATNRTAIALSMYSLGMVAFGLRDILGKVFYSLQDTKTPMINGAASMILNIILNLILVNKMGYYGLALATSISAIICIFLLFSSLKKRIGYYGQDKIIKVTIKSITSAIFMSVCTLISYNLISNTLGIGNISKLISLFGSVAIGAISYIIPIILLKVEEVKLITNIIRKTKFTNNKVEI